MRRPETPAVIRELEPGDLPALAEMYRTFEPRGRAKGLPPVREEKASRWLEHLASTAGGLMAVEGGRIAGHVILAEQRGEAEVALFVHQDFRNRGLGGELIRAAVDLARRRGYSRLWLTVSPDNPAALRVYARCGFRAIPEKWFPDHEMELWLSAGAAG